MAHPPMHESLAALLGAFGAGRSKDARPSTHGSTHGSARASTPSDAEQLATLSALGFSIAPELLS